jgi:cytochrome c-type biogenesis protein CcmE
MSRPPDERSRGRGGRRWLLALGVAGVLAVGVAAALNGTLVYDRSPAQLRQQPVVHQQVRLSGTVQPGSTERTDGGLDFVLVGGGRSVTVHSDSLPTSAFREGGGAVVEGHLDSAGVFQADRVITEHGNTYRAADSPSVQR